MGDYLPDSRPFFRRNSINPNEIGGALAWLVPFCAVAIFYPWHRDRWAWRIITMMIFVASALAMILGQSRFGLLGVLGALTIAFILLFPNWRLRLLLFTVITMVGILQAGVLLNLFTDDGGVGLSERDERSASQRLAIWSSAWAMIEDYPLTGVGLNNFRFTPVRNRYPIIGYDYLKPPHAHNELLQIGADMGLAGMAVFIGLHGAMLIYLWISYQRGIHPSQIVAVAVGAGILAHIGYSIGDAIPIWDRLHFVFWTMLGVGMAGYHLRRPIDISNP
jgi:O-antigen ligase